MARVTSVNKVYTFESVIRGYHIYKEIWDAEFSDELYCEIEETNQHDRHAVSLVKNGEIVGHIPRENSKISKFYIKRGGSISCQVTGKRQNNNCGLEIPAIYTYTGNKKDTESLEKLLKKV